MINKQNLFIFLSFFITSQTLLAENVKYYPHTFMWGAAFSAHQADGAFGGGENGDWYEFEHSLINGVSPIQHGNTADRATDHWHRYSEDYEWAQKLGLNSLRTSLAWEKIEPSFGVFSEDVIQHYRGQFQNMIARGIKPMIALHHFTHPKWFHEKGGWLNPESPKWFLEYASFVVKHLGDLCDLWITFNEPMILVVMGYLKAEIPPLMKSIDASYEASFNMARAHRMVAYHIHQVQGDSPNGRGSDGTLRGVSFVNSLQIYDPLNPNNPNDVRAAKWVTKINNWDFLRGVETGILKFDLLPELMLGKSFERAMPQEDLPPWAQKGPFMDWIGVNYYNRWFIKYNFFNLLKVEWLVPDGIKGDNGYALYPEGLEQVLRQTHTEFPKYPLIVSENGLADGEDSRRPDFIKNHLLFLDKALFGNAQNLPLDILGYYHWSLMDNFEWLHGYLYRFGLLEIQYDNDLKRVPRPSYFVYLKEIQKRKE
ncbi:MAG: glycoside hydrolase family 1 protein [Deltaproteobacteria bacterium]|nr:glycoside hydrolase family 1 protein [Deltaproteobacteria bacterium]